MEIGKSWKKKRADKQDKDRQEDKLQCLDSKDMANPNKYVA